MAKSSIPIVAKNVKGWCIFGTIPGNFMTVREGQGPSVPLLDQP